MAKSPKSYSKMPKEDKLVAGLIVIKKIPFSFDLRNRIFSVLEVLGQDSFVVDAKSSQYFDITGKAHWRIETKSERFLSEFKRQVAKSFGTKMPYEVEFIPSHKEVRERLDARDWSSDYHRHVGRAVYGVAPVIDFALIYASWLHRWSSVDGLVGLVLRTLGFQKRCEFCDKVLTFSFMKVKMCSNLVFICSNLLVCEARVVDASKDWEAHRAEGIKL